MIRLQNATLAAGTNDLLIEADLHLRPGDRVGLVGRNGTGKTTLIRALLGEIELENGKVHRRRDLRIGYLPQGAVSGSSLTVWDEVRDGMTRLVELREKLERAQAAADRDEPGAVEQLSEAMAVFEMAGGYSWDEKVGVVLHGLGFGSKMWTTPCNELSGGWQMRTALARMLLSEPDIALLDEPTNHLDLHARIWLAEALRVAPWTTLVVSHDRHLLDRVATRIVEVRNQQLRSWTGNFTRFLVAREEAREQELAAKEKQDTEIAHLQKFVDRFGAKATKAKQAKSRAKRIEKIDRIQIEAVASLPRVMLPEPPASAQTMVRLQGASIGWPDHPPLMEGIDLEVDRGMRIALVGDNGCGKSTLLKTLSGQLPPLAGRRSPGDRVRMGIFHQDLAASLPKDQTGFAYVSDAAPLHNDTKIRSILGALGLTGDRAMRPIGALSGGEKARVALASLTARPHNLLFLDEPTNHLDAETVEVLVRALKSWTGAMVFVSHDRYVVEQLATHVIRIAPPYELEEGVRPEHFERTGTVRSKAANPKKKQDHAQRKKQQRELNRARKRLDALPEALEEAEARVHAVDQQLIEAGEDWERASRLGEDRDARQAEVDALYEEWETLEARIEALEQTC